MLRRRGRVGNFHVSVHVRGRVFQVASTINAVIALFVIEQSDSELFVKCIARQGDTGVER